MKITSLNHPAKILMASSRFLGFWIFMAVLFHAGNTQAAEIVQERQGAAIFKGKPVSLAGSELKTGEQAPDFKVVANDFSEVTLASSKGKFRVITSLVSLDTPVCDLQAKRFNEEAAKFPKQVVVYVLSMDLPFAQKRWCGAAGATNIHALSDYRDASFGTAYGVLMKENRILSRSIFIIGPDDKIRYAEYVKDTSHQPDYKAALAALKADLG